MFFDTVKQDPADASGLGKLNAIPLSVVSKQGDFDVHWSVADGGTRLALDLTGFTAGDRLVFTIDVDEANDLEFTPLHWAAGNGHAGVVALLIDSGATATLKSHDGATPRDMAIAKGHADIARFLEAKGADSS